MDFILIFKAIIIAIVEALTEFIPVSSTGHEILVGKLIGFYDTPFTKMYMVVIQLAAILAVVVLFWQKIKNAVIEFFAYIFSGGKKGQEGFKFGINVIVGTIPAVIVGLGIHKIIEEKLMSVSTVAIGFIVGGILLIVTENMYRKKRKHTKLATEINDISYGQALTVGIFQCLSLWPGMSRSASTIIGGWLAGMKTSLAAEFSFFLAIPAMCGATIMSVKDLDFSIMNSSNWVALGLGCIVCFIVSYFVVEAFMNYLKKKPMRIFAVYRVAAGILLAVLIFTKVIQ